MSTKEKNNTVVSHSSINQTKKSLLDRGVGIFKPQIDEILLILMVIKSMVESMTKKDGGAFSERTFGDSPKDQLIQRIASTLAEIVTRKALSDALGQYFSSGTLANLQSQEALSSLVPVRFKDSKKVAYTKESVIDWLYENVVVIDETEQKSTDPVICKKAS